MPEISINQLAEFSTGTTATKRRIVNQQIKVDKRLVPWYQQAKSSIRIYLRNVSTYTAIDTGIEILRRKQPQTDRQKIDQKVSIEALEKIRSLKIPKILLAMDYEFIKPGVKTLTIEGVDIIIAPDAVIKANFKGKTVYGAVKIHISKGKPFDQSQAQCVATLLHKYLSTVVANKNEIVLPELCFCLDVFSDRVVGAAEKQGRVINEIKDYCLEVKRIWSTLQ